MDLNEAGQRIFRRHWALILLLTLVGLAAPVAIARFQQVQYVATARVDLGTDVRGGQEANSLADTALAVATSPDVLAAVVKQTKVPRSATTIVDELQVSPVGTSGVLELSITDPDPHICATVVNALAATVVKVRNDAEFGGTETLLAQVQQQYAAVTRQVGAVQGQIERESQVPAFTTTQVQDRSAALSTLAIEHSTLLAQESTLDRQRQQLIQDLASATRPDVIDDSSKAGIPVQNSLSTRMAIGGVLGLLLGVALAAVREALRPTLYMPALARRVGAPLLGVLPRTPRTAAELEDQWLPQYVTVAAEAAGVRTVQLVSVGRRKVDVTGLSRCLDGRNGLRVVPLALPGDSPDGVPPATVSSDAGIVVVASKVVKGRALKRLEQHLSVTRQPVLGVIGVRRRRSGRPAAGDTSLDESFVPAATRDPATPPSEPSTTRSTAHVS